MNTNGNRILLLHPGEMGGAIGRALIKSGQKVTWISEGRSDATRQRAETSRFEPIADLKRGLADADLVMSVCPPDAAEAQASTVAKAGYQGPYVDCNAVAPATMQRIDDTLSRAGATVIDAGIVGPPPEKEGTTRFYISGPGAEEISKLFAGSVVEAIPAGEKVGAASAIKMAYAAWTKGTSALLIAVHALARSEGIEEQLLAEWAISQPALLKRNLSSAIAKGWRFVGEMNEILKTFADNDLPAGFHAAAAELYQAFDPLKDKWDASLDEALAELNRKRNQTVE